MSTSNRLNHAFTNALELPLGANTKYVLVSDCHRGVGTSSDNFLKNQHLYFAALKHYYHNGFSYIELGDGDELWENRNMESIIEVHSDVFWLFSLFYKENRLYMIYGNHDMIKKKKRYSKKKCGSYFCTESQKKQPLFPNLTFHEGIILRSSKAPSKALYLTHGHQASLLNSTFWPLSQFFVRYFWRPLENFGVLDPTSAAKNYHVKHKTEERLNKWATDCQKTLITGHTHRPVLPEEPAYYYNTGSCVHPRCITCIEIENCSLTLVKWSMSSKADSTLYVAREVLSGPVQLFR
ncbi:MAG: serine/threonine protein phosphatase [Lachnospiraceae bacterium]|nr:serine/threonine protein phosphatase [Lachnospiraceae bacterium]